MPAPIQLTLYDGKDNEIATYTKSVIPWGILKKAMKLREISDDFTDADFERISTFVCELFGDQFTTKDLENGADYGEIMSVIQAVVKRAGVLLPNSPRGK